MKILIWSLVIIMGLYILYTPSHPVWINAGDFLNHNAGK
jgi:hypothetical protein